MNYQTNYEITELTLLAGELGIDMHSTAKGLITLGFEQELMISIGTSLFEDQDGEISQLINWVEIFINPDSPIYDYNHKKMQRILGYLTMHKVRVTLYEIYRHDNKDGTIEYSSTQTGDFNN